MPESAPIMRGLSAVGAPALAAGSLLFLRNMPSEGGIARPAGQFRRRRPFVCQDHWECVQVARLTLTQ